MNDKINELKAVVEEQRKSAFSALIRTAVIYCILIIAVFCYTTYIYNQISSLATPEATAALIIDQLEAHLPTAAQQLAASGDKLGVAAADRTVEAIAGIVPQAGDTIRAYADQQIDAIASHLEENTIPIIRERSSEIVDRLLDDPELTVDNLGQRVITEVSLGFDEVGKTMFGNDFNDAIYSLQNKIKHLANDRDLTNLETSEKMILACWLYLSKNAEVAPEEYDPIATIVEAVNNALKGVGFVDPDLGLDPNAE